VFRPWADTAQDSPQVLLCALVRLGYDGPIPVYCCHPFQAHNLNYCEVRVEIPVDPVAPCTGAVIEGDLDDAVKKMAEKPSGPLLSLIVMSH
jgi:hypothetical protein